MLRHSSAPQVLTGTHEGTHGVLTGCYAGTPRYSKHSGYSRGTPGVLCADPPARSAPPRHRRVALRRRECREYRRLPGGREGVTVSTVSTRTRECCAYVPCDREGVMVSTVSTRTREHPPLPGGREDVVEVEPLRLAAVAHAHCPLLGLSGKTFQAGKRLSGNAPKRERPKRDGPPRSPCRHAHDRRRSAAAAAPARPIPLRPFPRRPFPLRRFPLRRFPRRRFPRRPLPTALSGRSRTSTANPSSESRRGCGLRRAQPWAQVGMA